MSATLLCLGFVFASDDADLLTGGWVETTESGVEVDLVAVAGADGRWRRPGGESLEPVDIQAGTIKPRDDQVAVRFLLQVKAGEDVSLSPSAAGAAFISPATPVKIAERPVPQLVVLNAAYDADQVPEAVDVTVSVGAGEWRRVAGTGGARTMVSTTNDAGRRAVAIIHAEETDPETVFAASVALWGGGESSDRLTDEYRLVAFDADGTEVPCRTHSSSGGYLIQLVGRASDAERFVLQKRPREVVTFRSVRLHVTRRTKSDPEVD